MLGVVVNGRRNRGTIHEIFDLLWSDNQASFVGIITDEQSSMELRTDLGLPACTIEQ